MSHEIDRWRKWCKANGTADVEDKTRCINEIWEVINFVKADLPLLISPDRNKFERIKLRHQPKLNLRETSLELVLTAKPHFEVATSTMFDETCSFVRLFFCVKVDEAAKFIRHCANVFARLKRLWTCGIDTICY
ncbi:MAG: hypothetical protein ACTS68_00595 [Candidatus Hodgkinia cicadicola]